MAIVSASDLNDTDAVNDKSNSECCSFVIQEEDGMVFAFRQDTPLNGRGVVIHNETISDLETGEELEIVKEEIDTPDNHFVHAVVTEDGWVASHGGDSYILNKTLTLESIAREMLLSKNISSDSLSQIQDIFKYFKYGHFFIKDPDGNYGIAYYQTCLYGTLKPGEFLIIPNEYYDFRGGNATDYAIDPVDAIIEICSYENTGWNRRNLHSYDYKLHDTPDGQKYGVDIYATNDNGLNVGLNTSKIVSYVYYNDEFHPASTIPQNPNKLYLGTHIFKNQPADSVFEVMNSSRSVLVNTETSVHYRINNVDDEMTAVFVLDDDVEFTGAEVSQGDYHYDSSQNMLYWNLSESNGPNDIILNVKPKAKGAYNIRSYVQDTDDEINVTAYATDYGASLTSENVTTYKTYYKSLDVYLTDGDGVPLIGEKVSIMIDGTTYEREVTPKGYAALSIMLQPGEYDALISYDGQFGRNQTTSKIIVKKTILSDDLESYYGQSYAFNVSFLDENGNAYANGSVDFSIDGTLINKLTDANGTYSLEISHDISKIPKLKPGNHTITSYNGRTNEYVTNRVIIKEPVCDLSIIKTINATSIHIGDLVKWTVNVLNNGPCDAHGVLVTDAMPSGIKYISHNASKGFYDEKCGIWTIGNLTIGESITLELYCIALEEGLFTNGVNVTCNETDINLSNNYANSTVEVTENVTPVPPSPPTPNHSNTTNSTSLQVAEPAKMLATGNPIAYLITVIMVIFGSIWIPNRKR
ncbi:MAG: hypothetical protein ABS871_06950 [Methanobrevibacter sp.]